MYEIKSTTKDNIIKSITKPFLKNLLGRWGLDLNKYVTKLLSNVEFEWVRLTKKIRAFVYKHDKVLVTHDKNVSKEIVESHNLDYNKKVKKK